jgi:DNA (cytosine-5)-methyltransferase 1
VKEAHLEKFAAVDESLRRFLPNPKRGEDSYQLLDFFSCAGGMRLGFHAYSSVFGGIGRFIGFDVCPRAIANSGRNLGEAAFCDVRALARTDDIVGALGELVAFEPQRPTILIGCPPCQGYSAHNRTRGLPDDVRNSLILDFAKIAVAIQPEVLIIENVPEILAGKYRMYWDAYEDNLRLDGYFFVVNIIISPRSVSLNSETEHSVWG